MKPRANKPTDAELAILRVLWKEGPQTVRHVHNQLHPDGGGGGYTGTLKMMQLMHQKGLLHRDDSARAHVYEAAIEKSEVQERVIGDMLQRLFDGSRSQLVLQALGTNETASAEELQHIRELLEELEKRNLKTRKDEK